MRLLMLYSSLWSRQEEKIPPGEISSPKWSAVSFLSCAVAALYSHDVSRTFLKGRTPTRGLLLALVITLCSVVVYSWYIRLQIAPCGRYKAILSIEIVKILCNCFASKTT